MIFEIKQDLYRLIPESYSFKNLMKGFSSKGFQYLFFYRLYKSKANFIVKSVSRFVIRILMFRYGFQIPKQAEIGGGLFIGHFGTIVISANAKLGENCNIAHNVTIGAARGSRSGAPTIGNKVWIGTGAVLTGNIMVGDDVIIAPNAFVNFDVPSNSIALGNPAKIIKKENPTREYINNILEKT